TDVVSPAKRSWMMSRIGPRNTRPELIVRSYLHRAGLRFRVHVPGLPGRPDVVLPRHRSIVLVHGCFWHRHPHCRFAYTPKTNVDFWARKFTANVDRDRRQLRALTALGWRVLTIWECQVSNNRRLIALCRSIR